MKRIIKLVSVLIVILGSLQSPITITMERKKFDINLNIHKDPLTALYDIGHSSALYIPEEELIDANGQPVDLKKLFEGNDICTIESWTNQPWNTKGWETAYKIFKDAKYDIWSLAKTFYPLDELLKLLPKAKTIIKSFLPTGNFSFIFTQNEYIKKHGINRLFTYAKLQQVIAEKNLTHIRLPLKFLLIKDKTTGRYISTKQALQVIDDILKISLDWTASFAIEAISNRYTLDIFAKKEAKEGKGFSETTMRELFILCREAPFDIGDDNIFWDSQGDAVIIDTEHKSASTDDCIKLNRYPIDESLTQTQKNKGFTPNISRE